MAAANTPAVTSAGTTVSASTTALLAHNEEELSDSWIGDVSQNPNKLDDTKTFIGEVGSLHNETDEISSRPERTMRQTRAVYVASWLLAACGVAATIVVLLHLLGMSDGEGDSVPMGRAISLGVCAAAQLSIGALTLCCWRGHEDMFRALVAKRNRNIAHWGGYAYVGHEDSYMFDRAVFVLVGTACQSCVAITGIVLLLLFADETDEFCLAARNVGVVCMTVHLVGLYLSTKRLEWGA